MVVFQSQASASINCMNLHALSLWIFCLGNACEYPGMFWFCINYLLRFVHHVRQKLTLGKIHWPGWGYGMLEANRRRLKFNYVDTRVSYGR